MRSEKRKTKASIITETFPVAIDGKCSRYN